MLKRTLHDLDDNHDLLPNIKHDLPGPPGPPAMPAMIMGLGPMHEGILGLPPQPKDLGVNLGLPGGMPLGGLSPLGAPLAGLPMVGMGLHSGVSVNVGLTSMPPYPGVGVGVGSLGGLGLGPVPGGVIGGYPHVMMGGTGMGLIGSSLTMGNVRDHGSSSSGNGGNSGGNNNNNNNTNNFNNHIMSNSGIGVGVGGAGSICSSSAGSSASGGSMNIASNAAMVAALNTKLTGAAHVKESHHLRASLPDNGQSKRGRKGFYYKREEPTDEVVQFSSGVSSRGRERKPKQFLFADEQSQFSYSLNASNSQRYQRRIKGDAYDDGELITLKAIKAAEDGAAAAAAAAGAGAGAGVNETVPNASDVLLLSSAASAPGGVSASVGTTIGVNINLAPSRHGLDEDEDSEEEDLAS